MIDEKALIKTLNGIEEVLEAGTMKNTIGCVIGTIQEQPQVNEWIPVEERLPNIAGYPCLCTIENMYGQRKVAKLFTNYGIKPFWLSNEKDIDLSVWKVIAWQPLPEPYVKER